MRPTESQTISKPCWVGGLVAKENMFDEADDSPRPSPSEAAAPPTAEDTMLRSRVTALCNSRTSLLLTSLLSLPLLLPLPLHFAVTPSGLSDLDRLPSPHAPPRPSQRRPKAAWLQRRAPLGSDPRPDPAAGGRLRGPGESPSPSTPPHRLPIDLPSHRSTRPPCKRRSIPGDA